MKNIHVTSTDKLSRLYLGNNGNFVFGMLQTSIQSRNSDFTNQNIYITSDEEIKEGDWVIYENGNIVKADENLIFNCSHEFDEFWRKVILTTDQDLIKDGVQPIDDTFLEWFVENPSCEYVPIIPPLFGHPYIIWIEALSFKEESTLEQIDQNNPVTKGSTALVHKEETLELEAEEHCERIDNTNSGIYSDDYDSFIAGATSKWVEKQKLEFAIKELMWVNVLIPFEHKYAKDCINEKIKELEQKISEL